MDKEGPSAKITKDIENEKVIIRIHKERQVQILQQISGFKVGMESKISTLTEQKKSSISDQERLRVEKEHTSQERDKTKQSLDSEILELQKQNDKSNIQHDESFTKNADHLVILQLEIEGKKTTIDKIKKANDDSNQNYISITSELNLVQSQKTQLKKEIDNLLKKTLDETTNCSKLKDLDREHTATILLNIEVLKNTTNEMQQELEKSIVIQDVISGKIGH